MATVAYTADNLITATEGLIVTRVYNLEAGIVVRGEILARGITGLVKLSNIEYVQADATSATHISTTTSQDLVQGDLIFHIAQNKMYQYVGANALGVNLSIAVYTNGGLYQAVSKIDIPYCIAISNADATASAVTIDYSTNCSVLASELTFGIGSLTDFRDALAISNILVEE